MALPFFPTLDTASWWMAIFVVFNYLRDNGFFVYWSLVALALYQVYRFVVWFWFNEESPLVGHKNAPKDELKRFEHDFVTNVAKLGTEDIKKKRFVSDDGLEVEISQPVERKQYLCRTAIVLTHPWSVLGGDMDNNVPERLAQVFAHAGYVTVRFNFPGVGKSKGHCTWRASAERSALLNVVDMLTGHDPEDPTSVRSNRPGYVAGIERVLLVGYSYGSMVSNACVRYRQEIIGFVSISCPFNVIWFLSLCGCHRLFEAMSTPFKPKLLICGNVDNFLGPQSFQQYVRKLPEKHRRSVTVDMIDHSWWGQEVGLGGMILSWMRKEFAEDDLFQQDRSKGLPDLPAPKDNKKDQ
jgi:alpha/beta superfamily hydrolase